MTLDDAHKAFVAKIAEWKEYETSELTESDTRGRIIDYFLEHVLGWNPTDIRREAASPSGFTDYLLKSGKKNVAVLEAKRASNLLVSTSSKKASGYKLYGPALKNGLPGIKQAISYSVDNYVGYPITTYEGVSNSRKEFLHLRGSRSRKCSKLTWPELDSQCPKEIFIKP